MNLDLRITHKNDLPFVWQTEEKASKDGFVILQSIEEHEEFLSDEDIRHLIIETERRPVGYVVLAGLKNKKENIELRRIVVSEKGKGFGRKAVQLVKKVAFEELKANRLWLDVFDFNKRARDLYESEGFTIENIQEEYDKRSLVFMSILMDDNRKN